MPATERCPGQPSVALEFFILTTQFAFGHGCVHPGSVLSMLKPFHFPSTFLAGNIFSGMDVRPSCTSAKPDGTYQFTKFACPAAGGFHLDDYSTASYGGLNVQECELWGGTNVLGGTSGTTLLLDNNLFARSCIGAAGSGSLSFSNNLVWGTASARLNPSSGTVWYAFNNDFDSTTIGSSTLTNGYNAYLNCSGHLLPMNSSDILSSSIGIWTAVEETGN